MLSFLPNFGGVQKYIQFSNMLNQDLFRMEDCSVYVLYQMTIMFYYVNFYVWVCSNQLDINKIVRFSGG